MGIQMNDHVLGDSKITGGTIYNFVPPNRVMTSKNPVEHYKRDDFKPLIRVKVEYGCYGWCYWAIGILTGTIKIETVDTSKFYFYEVTYRKEFEARDLLPLMTKLFGRWDSSWPTRSTTVTEFIAGNKLQIAPSITVVEMDND